MAGVGEGLMAVIAVSLLLITIGLGFGRRSGVIYRASPAQLRTARRALRHFGSYDAMERAAERREDGVHVLRIPKTVDPDRDD